MAAGTTGDAGMTQYAVGKRAIGECDRCGFRYKLKELKKLTINEAVVDLKVCPTCWEPDHPQNLLGKYPVRDPQAVRDPRPDYAGYAESRDVDIADLDSLNNG